MKKTFFRCFQGHLGALCVVFMQALTGMAWAATTDIADTPVLGGIGVSLKPNIMLLMDTSNSMSWTHMPDQLEVEGAKQSIGYKSSQCNSLYYNPAQTYKRPKDASNALLPTPSFTAAAYDYYLDTATKVDLSSSFQAHDATTVRSVVLSLADTKQAAYYYVYTGSATLAYNTLPCTMADTGLPNSAVTIPANTTTPATVGSWTRKLVSSTSGVAARPDERENFAIWYTFYRTRMGLAKSAIGQAFAPLNDKYRVGFLNGNPTISGTAPSITPSSSVQSSRYEKIANFDNSQKINWFSKLNAQYPAGSSPTREALARVGRHYAAKSDGINSGMPVIPQENGDQCRSNYTILTTDGYWNTEAEKAGKGGGPTNIAGDAWVGQQDNPWTPDTGLVPFGVYDFTTSAIGYTETSTTTGRYSLDACSLIDNGGKFTHQVKKSEQWWKKVMTTGITNNTVVNQRRTSQVKKRTWKVTKSTSQRMQSAAAMTKSTTQSLWYNAATEQTKPVASCAGLSGCTTNYTGPTADASCVAEVASSANGYLTVTCTSTVVASAVASCSGAGCTQVTTGPTAVAGNACTNTAATAGNQYTTTTCAISNDVTVFIKISDACSNVNAAAGNVTCTTTNSAWTTVASCTASPGTAPDWIATQCQTANTCVINAGNTCTATTVTTYGEACTVVAGTTCTLVDKTTKTATKTLTPVDPATCIASTSQTNPVAANNWIITTCTSTDSTPVAVASCTPLPATLANNWTETLCTGAVSVGGKQLRKTDTTVRTKTYTSGLVIGPTTDASVPYSLIGSCVKPDPAVPVDVTVINPPTNVLADASGGSVNSLADVAQYYYKTDLRPDLDNKVRPSGTAWNDDKATWQHMTTFVVGLGVSGTKQYQENYLTATTGDFAAIREGTGSWPLWPDPGVNYASNAQLYNDPKSIDDFWHTAVNGRGKYFSANNPDSVVAGIKGVLSAIDATIGAGSGVAISDLAGLTISGLNYFSSYTTGSWVGDVKARLTYGTEAEFWSASAKMATQTQAACDDRNIYVRKVGGTNDLGTFTNTTTKCADGSVSSDLSAGVVTQLTAQLNQTGLSQYPDFTDGTLATVNQVGQATVSSLVNYLRGQRQNEGFVPGVSGKLYRTRGSVLGDIVNSKPQYVGAPYRDYGDIGYAAFKSAQAARQGMIYVGANDGMLHAFYAPLATATGTELANAGKEAWAYIPSQVIPRLSLLAGNNYAGNHHFFVDGTPVIADVSETAKIAGVDTATWRTILVGGLNAGGNGFYALDITNPTIPKSLWEFDLSKGDVGLSFGKPVIGKLKDGTWVVLLTSGYNNATGKGIVFVINAMTGVLIRSINTGAGDVTNPSGLAQVSAWTEFAGISETMERAYGGDLLGNVWKFDINNSAAPDAKLIATAKDSAGVVQSIVTAPELGSFKNRAYVYVGTGRLLGFDDLNRTQTQTVYGIWDDLTSNASISDLRSMLKHNETDASTYTIKCKETAAVCKAENSNGWYADLSVSKEQINLPLTLVGSTLVIVSNQPQADACSTGGTSRVYFAEGDRGTTVGPGLRLGDNGLAGVTIVNEPGTPPSEGLVGTSDSVKGYARDVSGTRIDPFTIPINPPPPGTSRTSWRELVQP
jgi:Tfp pilus tip-associated adhesin PilY1